MQKEQQCTYGQNKADELRPYGAMGMDYFGATGLFLKSCHNFAQFQCPIGTK